jgi:DNA polymerase III subunit alpha
MMFATLDDLEGQVEILVFNSAYAKNADKLDVDQVVIVRGRVDHKEQGETKLVVQEAEPFEASDEEIERAAGEEAERAAAPPRRLTVQVAPGVAASFLEEFKEIVRLHPGSHEVMLRVGERSLLLGDDYRVSADSACRHELASLPGAAGLLA